jgi:hypothetical protein
VQLQTARARHAGSNLLVIRFGVSRPKEILLTNKRFEQNGVTVTIFNAVENYSYEYRADAKASAFRRLPSITAEQVPAVDLVSHIADLVGHAVREDHIGLLLEGGEVIDDA